MTCIKIMIDMCELSEIIPIRTRQKIKIATTKCHENET